MPSEEIPLEERQDAASSVSSSSSENLSREHSIELNNVPENEGQIHIVNMRNLNNNLRNLRIFDRPTLPAPSRYYPIVIPAEPTIEELLRQASGTSELHKVTEIKLKVISHMTSLQRIPFFIPTLKALNLEGSIVMTLRDLGCDMTSLVYLNVSRCNLKTLDGTNGLETLEELVADYNLIEEVGPCTNLSVVKKISLKGNKISDLGSVTFLALCEKLEILDLNENFVTENPAYRHMLQENIPQLKYLDGISISGGYDPNSDLSSSEYKSSSSSNDGEQPWHWNSERGDGINWNRERPVTSKERTVTVELLDNERPSTADTAKIKGQLTSGEPLCGSILTKARRSKRQRTAWGESTSCSSMSSSDSSYSKDFPDRLPQKSFDLELGVIGIQNNSVEEMNDSQSLLQAARLWRQRSLQTREAIRDNDNMRILSQFREE